MKKLEFIDLEACEEAADWASGKTWEEVYSSCHRGDWLLWLFAKTNPDNLQELTLAKGHCANTIRHLMKDERSISAVDAAIAYGEGKITKEELDVAAYAAYAYAAYAATAAYAVYAAAAAAFASFAAANAAAYAAFASYAAYATDDAATYAATGAYATAASYAADAAAGYAEKKNQQQTADICRKYLPIEIWNIKN